MDTKTTELYNEAQKAKMLYKMGDISRAEVIHRIKPYILHVNEKGKEISKRFGMRPKTVSAISFLR